MSGQRLVPVLVDDGEVVFDSPKIVDWLEQRFPQPALFPTEPAQRAQVRIFVEWFNLVWKRPPNALADELERERPDESRIAEASELMRRALRVFEDLLEGREYLFGEFGAADVMAFPFLKYAAFGLPDGDDELFHRVLVEHQPLADGSPIRAWAARVDAHPRS